MLVAATTLWFFTVIFPGPPQGQAASPAFPTELACQAARAQQIAALSVPGVVPQGFSITACVSRNVG
jgi:hypothetical protein